jgi:hypothetical protein
MPDINSFQIAISLQIGWSAEVYSHDGRHGIAHLTNENLPLKRGDFGSAVIENLGPQGIFAVLFEYESSRCGTKLFAKNGVPWPLDAKEFSPKKMRRQIPGKCGYQGFFSTNGRAFCIYCVLGSFNQRSALTALLNGALEGINILATQ